MGPPHATPRKGNSESGIHIQTKVSPSQLPLDDRKLTQPQCDRSPNRANASNAPTPPLSRHQLRQPPPQHRPATPNGALNPCRLHPRLQTIHETRHIRHDVDPSRARFWHLRCFGCFGRLPHGRTFQEFEPYQEKRRPGFCAGVEVYQEDDRGCGRFEEES